MPDSRHIYKTKKGTVSNKGQVTKPITLLLAQTSPKLAKKEENLKTIAVQANAARKKGFDLLVFPELHLTGYTMQDEVYNLAEPIPGPSVKRIEKLAREHKQHIMLGMPKASTAKGV